MPYCVVLYAANPRLSKAVLTDRFAKINNQAEVEWRLVSAKLVKEHFQATVLPSPFNVFELAIDMVCNLVHRCGLSWVNSNGRARRLRLTASCVWASCVCATGD